MGDATAHFKGDQDLHSETLIGAVTSGPGLTRTIPSEVEQKFLDPVLAETGLATMTYSSHIFVLQTACMLNRKPDFTHQFTPVHVGLPSVESMNFAWAGDGLPLSGAGPRAARLRAQPLSRYVIP